MSINKELIEKRLGENLNTCSLFKETSCSYLYYIVGKKEYVLKKSKKGSISEAYENHKKVYDCWIHKRSNLGFKIPETYFLSQDKTFYVMTCIKNAVNLQDVLLQGKSEVNDLFERVGNCIKQYHELMTENVIQKRENIYLHDTINQLLHSRKANKVRRCFEEFDADTYRIIFKDFTLSNIVLDSKKNIYFLDFQKIYYYAPFYYDLARLIDTARVFSLVQRPVFTLFHRRRITQALRNLVQGYGDIVDEEQLKEMHKLHRAEHIQIKYNKNTLGSIVLRLIYFMI